MKFWIKFFVVCLWVVLALGCTNNMTMTGGDSSSGTSGPSGSNTGNDQSQTSTAVAEAVQK